MTSFKAGLMACAVKGAFYKRIKVRVATRENEKNKIKRV